MTRPALPLLILVICACAAGRDSAGERRAWTTTTTTVGDTTIVRTSGVDPDGARLNLAREWSIGSLQGDANYAFGFIKEFAAGPDNSIFVFDQQYVQLRQYDSTGTFVRTLGSRGMGPGEYERVNGLAAHSDGRVVLWNASTANIMAWSPDIQLPATWKVPGSNSFNTSNALMVDTAGNTYARTRVGDAPAGDDMARTGRMFGITGVVRYGRDGTLRDSIRPVEIVLDAPRLVASVEGNTSMSPVPFSPMFLWTFSPHGAFVSARSDVYAIDITRIDGGVTRIEMEGKRIGVAAAERSDNETVITANMRRTDPNWKWNGAPIPDVKPYFKSISVARDGRIWVSLSTPGEEIPADELPQPTVVDGQVFPVRKWREPVAYDVFEGDGTYVGRVAMPPRTTWRAANGEMFWAVTRDSLDLEQISRFRVSGRAR